MTQKENELYIMADKMDLNTSRMFQHFGLGFMGFGVGMYYVLQTYLTIVTPCP